MAKCKKYWQRISSVLLLCTLVNASFGQKQTAIDLNLFIRCAEANQNEKSLLETLAETMLLGTQEFTQLELQKYGFRAGKPMSFGVHKDFMCLRIFVEPKDLELGLSLLESIVCRPTLDPKQIDQQLLRQQKEIYKPTDFFRAEIIKNASSKTVLALAQRVLKKRNFFLYSDYFKQKSISSISLNKRVSEWKERNYNHYEEFNKDCNRNLLLKKSIHVFQIKSKAISPKNPDLSEKLLSWVALSVGKGSSFYQIFRNERAWIYHYESMFVPTSLGLLPSLIFMKKDYLEPKTAIGDIKKALLEDVGNWNNSHLIRAKAFLEGCCKYQFEISPFRLLLDSKENSDLFWKAYQAFCGREPVSLDQTIAKTQLVSLDQLKRCAIGLVEALEAY